MWFAGTELSADGEVVTHSYSWDISRTAVSGTLIVVVVLLARRFIRRRQAR